MGEPSKNSIPVTNFAVCLAAFNGEIWLPKQIESILNQSGVVVTVFVSIDKSTDGTQQFFEQIILSEERIFLLPYGERFGGAAKNFFRLIRDIDFKPFDYVAFADQDDIWLPNKLLRAHEILISTNADAYSSNVTAFWPDGRQVLIDKSQPQVQWDFLFEAAGPGCTYVMRKELACAVQATVRTRWNEVKKVGLHDWFMYAFARVKGYRWVIDDMPSMLYRQHEHNQVGVNTGRRAFLQRAKKVLSGWGLDQSVLIASLVGLSGDPFVLRWINGSRLGMLTLALSASKCRRRMRDKFIFALSCLLLCIAGRSSR